jgi:hypothetical protein
MITIYLEELFKEPTELAYAAWWAFFVVMVFYFETSLSINMVKLSKGSVIIKENR